jgi:hypothetical protein
MIAFQGDRVVMFLPKGILNPIRREKGRKRKRENINIETEERR